MTTKVTVDAHAGWPVKVEALDTFNAFPEPATQRVELGIVPPNQVQDFYIHSTRVLIITEMPRA